MEATADSTIHDLSGPAAAVERLHAALDELTVAAGTPMDATDLCTLIHCVETARIKLGILDSRALGGWPR